MCTPQIQARRVVIARPAAVADIVSAAFATWSAVFLTWILITRAWTVAPSLEKQEEIEDADRRADVTVEICRRLIVPPRGGHRLKVF